MKLNSHKPFIINKDNTFELNCLKEHYDDVVINDDCNENEKQFYSGLLKYLSFNTFIHDKWRPLSVGFMCDVRLDEDDYQYSINKKSMDENELERIEDWLTIQEFTDKMDLENNSLFSFRFIPDDKVELFEKVYCVNKLFPELLYQKIVTDKKVLFLDTFDTCDEDISIGAESFIGTYRIEEVKIIKTNLNQANSFDRN